MTAGAWKLIGSGVLIILLAYIGVIVLLAVFQRSLIYHPDTSNAGDPGREGLENGRTVTVATQDGLALRGWFLQRQEGEAPVILYFHGNAGHHGWRADKLKALYNAGFSVLIAGYRGYGGNPGAPHEEGLYKDGQAFYDWLVTKTGTAPERLIIYGESLGTGVAVRIAADNAAAGLILETPFDSLTATAKVHYPWIPFIDILLRDRFPSNRRIQNIDMPVMFMIAGMDEVVPPERGRHLYEIAQDPKRLKYFEDARHNGLDPDRFVPYVATFVRDHVPQ